MSKTNVRNGILVNYYPDSNWIFTVFNHESNPNIFIWIYNRFLNIYTCKFDSGYGGFLHVDFLFSYNSAFTNFDILTCPFISKNVVCREQLSDCGVEPINFIKDVLSKGYYVALTVETSKISNYITESERHSLLITNYNSEDQNFTSYDYFNTSYNMEMIAEYELIQAIKLSFKTPSDNPTQTSSIIYFKENDAAQPEEIDLNWIKSEIDLFINPGLRSSDIYVTGIEVLVHLKKDLLQKIDENSPIVLKGMNALLSYNLLMIDRLRFLTVRDILDASAVIEKMMFFVNKISALIIFMGKNNFNFKMYEDDYYGIISCEIDEITMLQLKNMEQISQLIHQKIC